MKSQMVRNAVAPYPIHSRKLVLRPLESADLGLFVDLYSDPKTMALIGEPLSRSRARANFGHALEQWQQPAPDFLYWRVQRVESEEVVGLIALIFGENDPKVAEIGMILRQCALGLGLSKFAMWMLARHAFDHGMVEQIQARHAPEHRAAQRLVKRLGYDRFPGPPEQRLGYRWWRVVGENLREPWA